MPLQPSYWKLVWREAEDSGMNSLRLVRLKEGGWKDSSSEKTGGSESRQSQHALFQHCNTESPNIHNKSAPTVHPWERPCCCSVFDSHAFLSHDPATLSLSQQILLPLPPHSSYSLSPLLPHSHSVSFPYVPINLFPVHSSTQGLSVPITTGPSCPPPLLTHTLCAHSPFSLSLYQLGIKLLKQRASWRTPHHKPCEVLPLHGYTLLPILRTT